MDNPNEVVGKIVDLLRVYLLQHRKITSMEPTEKTKLVSIKLFPRQFLESLEDDVNN